VVSSALDTSVGIAAGVALAAALPELPYACGPGHHEPDGGRRRPGLAGRPRRGDPRRCGGRRPDLLEQHAAAPERWDWWLARLARCSALLAADSPV
jgi:O-succinylbenzoate synthase